jgi:hypothetical protein
VAGSGLANTNTLGTTIYYADNGACRVPVNFDIDVASTPPTVTPMPGSSCPNINLTLNVSGGAAATGSSINWYSGANGTGTFLGNGTSLPIVTTTASVTYCVRREGGCNTAGDEIIPIEVKDYIYGLNGAATTTYCTDNSGWHHFYNGSEILLSVQGDVSGANPGFPQITISDHGSFFQQSQGPFAATQCASGFTPSEERFEMERSWNVDFGVTGTFNPPYNVRFYYHERIAIETAALNWMATYPGCCCIKKYGTGASIDFVCFDRSHWSSNRYGIFSRRR